MQLVLKKQLKKKKGFTLVEVIVVLVILAILAAIAIPTLTGYIDRANLRAIASEGRTIGMALQTAITDAYGQGHDLVAATYSGEDEIYSGGPTFIEEVETLTGQSYSDGGQSIPEIIIGSNGTTLESFTYTDGAYLVVFENGEYVTDEVS
ncbi:MAG: prepilin-type N-terminal cleavage/methylation domain-containing protein [Clostridiales Family XIII bacterium]|jgi:prepilin-type N-terminal cleavage/methylation domain-containing protein|nr:prepilin-type N-terminal cleavage/methylation domain-containing protein [Clostridiales Family XIII bacterium]